MSLFRQFLVFYHAKNRFLIFVLLCGLCGWRPTLLLLLLRLKCEEPARIGCRELEKLPHQLSTRLVKNPKSTFWPVSCDRRSSQVFFNMYVCVYVCVCDVDDAADGGVAKQGRAAFEVGDSDGSRYSSDDDEGEDIVEADVKSQTDVKKLKKAELQQELAKTRHLLASAAKSEKEWKDRSDEYMRKFQEEKKANAIKQLTAECKCILCDDVRHIPVKICSRHDTHIACVECALHLSSAHTVIDDQGSTNPDQWIFSMRFRNGSLDRYACPVCKSENQRSSSAWSEAIIGLCFRYFSEAKYMEWAALAKIAEMVRQHHHSQHYSLSTSVTRLKTSCV